MDNANMVKSTPEDLKRFEDAVRLNLKDLGLMDWDCIFKLEDLETSNAAVRYHIPARNATFRLAQSREEFRPVEEHALHEALELLLAEIAVYLGAYYSDDLINNEVHRVINRLMTLLAVKKEPDLFAQAEIDNKYHELIMGVGLKFPGESRHETALRYIQERERAAGSSCAKSAEKEREA